MIGIQHFYIYDNGSDDDIAFQLEPYAALITYLKWPLLDQQQRLAYRDCLDKHGASSQWMAFIDVDEFIVYKGAGTFLDYLQSRKNDNGIMMQWVIFGTSGHRVRPSGLVIENYTQCHRHSPDPNIKTVCRPDRVSSTAITSPHRFAYIDSKPAHPETLEIIAVYHYVTRSLEDLAAKMSRGDVWSAERAAINQQDMAAAIQKKLALYDSTDLIDTHMHQFVSLIHDRLLRKAVV